jgi:hypothetical protein
MTRHRLVRAAGVVVAVALLVIGFLYLRGIPGHTRPHQAVGAQAQTLREAFNADAGTVRIVALVSPTCGACLRGATDMQAVFGDVGDTRLRGYIVWVPKLDGQENNVPEATHTVADPRAGHYWDANGDLVHGYDRTLDLGQDAWDIYLLYGPGTRWDGADPPAPAYWMNQLGGANGPTLDSQTFADHARALLHKPPPATQSGR